ncbi:hypothetical protein GIB67_009995 [Kingdonia uniflora]|uniref:DUF7950 domain-containing protein n=1 Tax=Kingdonia uniflora TaxID=39325 RepID=A0A7J7P0W4_9MAGN|nr:hypothetical protein GIB67_009995 [Kingdonia uniflora]
MMLNHSSYLNLYSSKTDQIMARYRPIAPKPQIPPPLINPVVVDGGIAATSERKTQHSPPFYGNPISPLFIQTRPIRSRKRGRAPAVTTTSKRARNGIYPYPPVNSSPMGFGAASLCQNNAQLGLTLQSFSHHHHGHGSFKYAHPAPANLVTLPYLPYPSSSVPDLQEKNISLSLGRRADISQEKDLLVNLHASQRRSGCCVKVIAPQPVRPVGSSISVQSIMEDYFTACTSKEPEEVEAEVELDDLPSVITDSSNRVRMVNSAYKEMVGQPECMWLDSMRDCDGRSCKRISGGVMLDLSVCRVLPVSSNGFSCNVRIKWGRKEGLKSSVHAACDVVKLSCKSKDYFFTWRFHTTVVSESNSKA